MKVQHYTEIAAEQVGEANNTTIRWLISKADGAPNFYMRLFEVGPGGSTPHHEHAWEHEVFFLEGTGKLVGEGISRTLTPGMFVFVPGGEVHHFENTGDTVMKFICLVPKT
jgi:quercetin dioxygenase-like cupin family protein